MQGAFKETDHYIYDLIKEGIWVFTKVIDEKTGKILTEGNGWNYDATLE